MASLWRLNGLLYYKNKRQFMKIEYNKSENSIQIRDGLKRSYLLLKILLILNLTNATIRLIGQDRLDYGVIEYFWIAIGLISLLALYYFLFKISTADKIPVDDIKSLREKSVFGRKRYSFELTNGKQRHLGNFKSEFDLAKFKELVKVAGIK